MQELSSGFESRQTVSEKRLVWIDTDIDPMTSRIWIALKNHGACLLESPREASEPADHAPDQTVVNDGLMRQLCVLSRCFFRRDRITNQAALMPDCLAIRDVRFLEILLGSR